MQEDKHVAELTHLMSRAAGWPAEESMRMMTTCLAVISGLIFAVTGLGQLCGHLADVGAAVGGALPALVAALDHRG